MNAIKDGLKKKLGLTPHQPTPFNLQMVEISFNKPLEIVPNIRIRIHGIPYIITFMVMNNKAIDPMYSILLGCPWLQNANVIHDWGTNMVTIKGNGTMKTIYVSKYLSGNIK